MKEVRDRRRAILASSALAVLVYLPSLTNGHALDDGRAIVENEIVHGLGNAAAIASSPYLPDVPPGRSPYRPITSLSYALSWSMGDGSPMPFHAFNVGLHALNTGLVAGLAGLLGAAPVAVLLAGSVFAVHPVHTEAVANGVGRGDALMTFFVLLGVLAYLRRWRRRWMQVGAIAVSYALALGAKENGVVLPGILLSVALLRPRRSDEQAWHPRRDLAPCIALVGVLVGYLTLRAQVLGTLVHRDAAPYVISLPSGTRMATGIANLTEHLRLLFFPLDLAADYGPAVVVPVPWVSAEVLGGVLVAALVCFAAWKGRRTGGWVALGAAWAAVGIVVVANIVFPVAVWIAERTLYLSSVGAAFVLIGAWDRLGEVPGVRARRWGVALAIALVAAGGIKTWSRAGVWESTDSVLQTLAEEHPESYRGQWWLGVRLVDTGQLESGLRWLATARALSPNDLGVHMDYVRALLLADRPQDAYEEVRDVPARLPARDVYLAQSLIFLGRIDEARRAVEEGLTRFPEHPTLRAQSEQLRGDSAEVR